MFDYFAAHDPVHQIFALTILCVSVFVVLTHNFARKELNGLSREIRDLQRAHSDDPDYYKCIICNEVVPDPNRYLSILPRPPYRPAVCYSCKRGIMAFRSIVLDENDKDK